MCGKISKSRRDWGCFLPHSGDMNLGFNVFKSIFALKLDLEVKRGWAARMILNLKSLLSQVGVLIFCTWIPTHVSALELNSVGLGLVSDSNPARAQFRDDIVFGQQASVDLGASLFTLPASEELSWGFFGSASLELTGVALEDSQSSDTGLGQNVVQFTVETERALAELPGDPLLVFGANLGYIDSSTNIRDSGTVGVSASLSYQPLQFLDFTFGLRHDERFAESEVFDTSKTQLFTSAFIGLAPQLSLTADAQLVFGNEVSTATPTVDIVDQADAIVPDSAFGGFDERRFAYLLDATSVLGSFGASYIFGSNILADAKLTGVFTDAGGGIDYSRLLLSFGLTYNFR